MDSEWQLHPAKGRCTLEGSRWRREALGVCGGSDRDGATEREMSGGGQRKQWPSNVAFAHQEKQGGKKGSVSEREVTSQRQGSKTVFFTPPLTSFLLKVAEKRRALEKKSPHSQS